MSDVIGGVIQLDQSRYFALRFKPTGQVYGKKACNFAGPEYLFETEAGAKRGLSLAIEYFQYSWHHMNKVSGSTDKSNWEVIPVDVEIKV